MTEVEYRREMNRNYMVLRPKEECAGRYAVKMLYENKIPGLLPFHEKSLDGHCRYYFDITSRQPLGRLLESRAITGREIQTLISAVLYTLKQMERYLLDEGQLNLRPEFIYVEPESFRCFLCLIPGLQKNFSEEFGILAKYLLDHVSHTDTKAVVLAFAIFQESQKLNFGMESLDRLVNQEVEDWGKGGREKDRTQNRGDEEDEWTGGGQSSDERRSSDENKERNRKNGICENIGQAGWERDFLRDVEPGSREPGGRKPGSRESGGREPGGREPESRKPESSEPGRRISPGGLCRVFAALMILLPLFPTILGGAGILRRYKWIFTGLELLLLLAILILRHKKSKDQEITTEIHQADERKDERKGERIQMSVSAGLSGGWEDLLREEEERGEQKSEEELQTILLSDAPQKINCRRLVPVHGGEEILFRYFPFLIGKNKDLADYCLERPGVSRLHLRIDEREGSYFATDLNSTNGTRVGEKALEANESCELKEGDEVEIAEVVYRFL